MTARNSAGWGAPSQPVVGEPGSPVAPGAVRQLAATSDSSHVTLSWSPPLDDGGAPLTGYAIRRALNCNPANSIGVAPTTGTSFTQSGLTSGTTYCFTVAAANSAVTGPTVSVKVTVARPTTPAPCSLQASWFPVQDGSVEWSLDVSWSTPADDGGSRITGYAVAWLLAMDRSNLEELQ